MPLLPSLLADPTRIQGKILDDLSSRFLNGEGVIVDPNNTAVSLIESFAAVTASQAQETIKAFNSLYRLRATQADELTKHMADFDYVNTFSTPAEYTFVLNIELGALEKYNIGADYTGDIREYIIPRGFSVKVKSALMFGLLYPIQLFVNRKTHAVSAQYITDPKNPLVPSMTTNAVEVRTITFSGINIVSMAIPMKQFSLKTTTEEVVKNTGFAKYYKYSDLFYAARVLYLRNGVWTDMKLTLSDTVYNPLDPTARLLVDTSEKTLGVIIPYVYFNDDNINRLGTKIKIELYTTMGAIDYDVSSVSPTTIVFSMTNLDSDLEPKVTPLRKLANISVACLDPRIYGGSNGLTFDELRVRSLTNSLYGSGLITLPDLINYFSDQGLVVTKYRDGYTDRIFEASAPLTINNVPVCSGMVPVKLTASVLQGMIDDGSAVVNPLKATTYTIYPKNRYRLEADGTYSWVSLVDQITLTDPTTQSLATIADTINSRGYAVCPFHLVLDMSNNRPVAGSYDMTAPSISEVRFVTENPGVPEQMYVRVARITRDTPSNRPNRYRLTLYVGMSTNYMKKIAAFDPSTGSTSTMKRILSIQLYSSDSTTMVAEADYVGLDAAAQILLFEATIDTTGAITTDGELIYQDSSDDYRGLTIDGHSLKVTSYANTSYLDTLDPSKLTDTKTYMTDQTITVVFGKLIEELNNRIQLSQSPQTTLKAVETEYAVFSDPVYQRDGDNKLIWSTNASTGLVEFVEMYSKGDLTVTSAPAPYNKPCLIAGTNFLANSGSYQMRVPYTTIPAKTNIWESQVDNTLGFRVVSALELMARVADGDSYTSLPDPLLTAKPFVFAPLIPGITPKVVSGVLGTNGLYVKSADGTEWELYTVTDTLASLLSLVSTNPFAVAGSGFAYIFGTISTRTIEAYHLIHQTAGIWDTDGIQKWPWECSVWTETSTFTTITDPLIMYSGHTRGYFKTLAGSDILDENGNPIVVDERETYYYTDLLLVDAKSLFAPDTVEATYLASTASTVKAYCEIIAEKKLDLHEFTSMYFKPVKTIGKAQFIVGTGQTVESNIEFSVELRLHLKPGVVLDTALKDTFMKAIVTTIDTTSMSGVVEATDLAVAIKALFPDQIKHVDVLSFNDGDIPGLFTLRPADSTVHPQLKQELYVDPTLNRLFTRRGVTLEYVLPSV